MRNVSYRPPLCGLQSHSRKFTKLFVFLVNLKKISMGHDAIKLELIEWLTRLDDDESINNL